MKLKVIKKILCLRRKKEKRGYHENNAWPWLAFGPRKPRYFFQEETEPYFSPLMVE